MGRSPSGSLPLPFIRWRGVNLQFFLLIFLPITALLLLITVGSLTLHQRAMRQLVGERDERGARTAAAAINEQLNHRASSVRGLALQATGLNRPEVVLDRSGYLSDDFDDGLAIYNSSGYLLAASGDIANWAPHQKTLSALLAEARSQTGARTVFSPLLSSSDGEPFVFVAFSGAPNAVSAVGAFSPAVLARQTLSGAFTPGEESTAFIVTNDRQLIYQVGAYTPDETMTSHPGVAEALRGESGTTYLQVDDSEHVVAFSPISTTGWALVIEEPWESVASPLLNTTQLAPLVLVPVLLLALVALWFGARQIVEPLQELESRAGDLAWGNYKTIEQPVGGIEEVRRLQGTLIHLAGKIQRAQQGLRGYIGAITMGQEDERNRLARELHDDTIQALIALNQRVQLTQLKLADNPQALAALDEIQSLTGETIQNLRRLTRALRPLYLEDLGLTASLEMLARETQAAVALPVLFQRSGQERRLPAETELALYRIAQEGLSNVTRHAQAHSANLTICYKPQDVILTLQDDGIGFVPPESPAEFAPGGHYGLLGMHERAELIGARLEIHSGPDEGTRLVVTLPQSKD